MNSAHIRQSGPEFGLGFQVFPPRSAVVSNKLIVLCRLWCLSEEDLLAPDTRYELRDTGQVICAPEQITGYDPHLTG